MDRRSTRDARDRERYRDRRTRRSRSRSRDRRDQRDARRHDRSDEDAFSRRLHNVHAKKMQGYAANKRPSSPPPRHRRERFQEKNDRKDSSAAPSKPGQSSSSSDEKKEGFNLERTGVLDDDARKNKNGVVMKYWGCPDGVRGPKRWRWYRWNDGKDTPILIGLHKENFLMIGRDTRCCHIHLRNISVSKQHAVVQHRMIGGQIKPYLMDLGSVHGTFVNDDRLTPRTFVELCIGDRIRFAKSRTVFVHLSASVDENIAEDAFSNFSQEQAEESTGDAQTRAVVHQDEATQKDADFKKYCDSLPFLNGNPWSDDSE